MFSTLRNRFGIPGVISVIALVFALVGGAFAANDGGSGNDATASAKKKAVKGPRGPKGATGAAGPAGPAGLAGVKGDTGAAGANGANGKDGASPTGITFSGSKGGCTQGGIEYKGATTNFVCNGKNGADGQTGFTEKLPSGMTETGAWSIPAPPSPGTTMTTASFAIPLEEEIPASNVHLLLKGGLEGEGGENCPGTSQEPSAEAGHFCMYVAGSSGDWEGVEISKLTAGGGTQPGASRSGALLSMVAATNIQMLGTWAVTAP